MSQQILCQSRGPCFRIRMLLIWPDVFVQMSGQHGLPRSFVLDMRDMLGVCEGKYIIDTDSENKQTYPLCCNEFVLHQGSMAPYECSPQYFHCSPGTGFPGQHSSPVSSCDQPCFDVSGYAV